MPASLPLRALLVALLCACLAPAQALTELAPTQGAAAFDYDAALAESQAAIGRELRDARFTASDGRQVTLAELRGKPLVLSLVYTSCYQICPMTTQYLSGVVDKARDALGHDSFAVALVGFDTSVDTPEAMRYFARKQGIADKDWWVLSTDAAGAERLAADTGFLITPTAAGFDHLIQATVIDADGLVYRQVYGQVFETPLLVDPLIELVLGRSPPEQPLLANLVDKIKLFCTTYDPARDAYFFDYSLFIGMLIGGSIIAVTVVSMVRASRHAGP